MQRKNLYTQATWPTPFFFATVAGCEKMKPQKQKTLSLLTKLYL